MAPATEFVEVLDATQPSHKRLRYVEKACERCKKQKIRCSGETPCSQCKRRRVNECIYRRSRRVNGKVDNQQEDQSLTTSYSIATPQGESSARVNDAATAFLRDLPLLLQEQNKKLDLLIERTSTFDDELNHFDVQNRSRAQRNQTATKPLHPSLRNSCAFAITLPARPALSLFQGPTSPAFSLNMVKMSLSAIYDNPSWLSSPASTANSNSSRAFFVLEDEMIDDEFHEDENMRFVGPTTDPFFKIRDKVVLSPLQDFSLNEAKRLSNFYNDIVNSMFAIVDYNILLDQLKELFGILGDDNAASSSPINNLQLDKMDVIIVKMVLAIGLLADGGGDSELAVSLFATVHQECDRIVWGGETQIKDLKFLLLVALYHILRYEWRVAWRLVGNMTRITLELGLHRRNVLAFGLTNGDGFLDTINTFWMIYVLDRQLSCSLGLPVTLHDAMIDSNLPLPVNDLVLKALVEQARIGVSSCEALYASMHSTNAQAERIALLQFYQTQLELWQTQIPDNLHFVQEDDQSPRSVRFLRTMFYVQANNIRILVMRPFLSDNIHDNLTLWTDVLHIANENIHVLVRLNESSEIYRFQQAQFNYFMMNSLVVILLYAAKISGTGTFTSLLEDDQQLNTLNEDARAGARAGLDLLRTLAQSFRVSKRLWEKISDLVVKLENTWASGPNTFNPDDLGHGPAEDGLQFFDYNMDDYTVMMNDLFQ